MTEYVLVHKGTAKLVYGVMMKFVELAENCSASPGWAIWGARANDFDGWIIVNEQEVPIYYPRESVEEYFENLGEL